MSPQIRSLAAALVFVLLAGGAAQALPLSGPSPSARGGSGFLDAAWGWVVSLFPHSGVQSKSGRVYGGEAGGMMDPNGSPYETRFASDTSTEAGGMMDPNGDR